MNRISFGILAKNLHRSTPSSHPLSLSLIQDESNQVGAQRAAVRAQPLLVRRGGRARPRLQPQHRRRRRRQREQRHRRHPQVRGQRGTRGRRVRYVIMTLKEGPAKCNVWIDNQAAIYYELGNAEIT